MYGNSFDFVCGCMEMLILLFSCLRFDRHNAAVYGVADRIEFVLGDCTAGGAPSVRMVAKTRRMPLTIYDSEKAAVHT